MQLLKIKFVIIRYLTDWASLIFYKVFHHQGVLTVWIPLTLSHYSSLSDIALDQSSRWLQMITQSWWMAVFASQSILVFPSVGVHRISSLISSSLLFHREWRKIVETYRKDNTYANVAQSANPICSNNSQSDQYWALIEKLVQQGLAKVSKTFKKYSQQKSNEKNPQQRPTPLQKISTENFKSLK